MRTLVRQFIRSFLAFKLEGGARAEAVRTLFMTGPAQAVSNEATTSVVTMLAQRIQATKPRWPEARAVETANMWASLVFGATTSMLERHREFVAAPWFGESLERAVNALLA